LREGGSDRAPFYSDVVQGTVPSVGPSTSDPPIPLERYAELSAEAQHVPPLSALLARESIDEATWAVAQAYWLARMADEARRQRYPTTSRYQASFERRRRALEVERKAKSAVVLAGAKPMPMAVPSPEPLFATDASGPLTQPAPMQPPPVALPVFVPESLGARAATPALPSPAPPVQVQAEIVPPATHSRPSVAQPGPTRPKQAPATMIGVLLTDPGQVLPFRDGPPSPPTADESATLRATPAPADAPLPSPPKRRVELGSTLFADGSASSQPATPFDAAPVTQPTPRRKVDLGATMMPGDMSGAPATPFTKPRPEQSGPSPEPRPSAQPLRASERVRAPIAGASPLGATLPPTTQPLPDAGSAGQGAGRRFSINVFASLTAEIAENPSEVEAIRRRYGIGEAEHREESERWTAAFDADDELRQRYLAIVQRYRGYVRNQTER
jgi:hypothetical protein